MQNWKHLHSSNFNGKKKKKKNFSSSVLPILPKSRLLNQQTVRSMGGACKNCSAIPLSSSRNDVVLTSSMGFCCKVVLNDEFLDHLFIPPRFARKIAPLTNKNVQIKDTNGRSWTVKLSYVRGALAFASGWRSFTQDHGIKPHNQVLFSYISDSNFLCQIFGNNSSKKWRFPSACNNRPSSSYANEDSSDGNITQINKEGSPLEQGKGVKRKYCEDPCFIVNRDSDFDQNEDRRCFLDINEFEMYNSLVICRNGSSTAQDADIEEHINESSFVEDCFNLPICEEDMKIPCEGGEDFGSSLLDSFPSTLVVAFAQIAPFEGPPVEVKSADLEPQAIACQGQTTTRPPAEAKVANLKPQATAFKGQTSDVTAGLEAEGQTETADFNCQKTAFQGQTTNFTGPAMEVLKADFSGQTTTHRNQDDAKEPRISEPKVFGNERAKFGGSVGIAKNEQKGLNPQGFCYKVSENNLDATEGSRELKAKDFGNETASIGGRVRTPKIKQKGQNQQVGSAKIAQEEPNKLNPQGLGGSVEHVKIEQKNFRPNGFGGRMRMVKEEPNFHLNSFGGRVRTVKEELNFPPNNFDASAQRVNNEQFNLQISRGTVTVGLVKKEPTEFEPQNVASSSYQALKKVKIEVQDFAQPPPTVTCAVTSDSNFLILPKQFSSLRTDMCVQSKVEFLKDSAGRLWPVMCCKEKSQQGLTTGWKSIRDANGVRIGDECVFSREENYQGIISMNVVQK